MASGPLTLITVIAPVPGTVAGATIVSSKDENIFLNIMLRNYSKMRTFA
jgi:hypothetical protein